MADIRQTVSDRSLREAEVKQRLVKALARHMRNKKKAGAASPDDEHDAKRTKTKAEDSGTADDDDRDET